MPDSAPTLAFLVANDVSNDERVLQMAASAAGAGFDVTVFGVSLQGTPRTTFVNGAEIVRPPVRADLTAANRHAMGRLRRSASERVTRARRTHRANRARRMVYQRDGTYMLLRLKEEMAGKGRVGGLYVKARRRLWQLQYEAVKMPERISHRRLTAAVAALDEKEAEPEHKGSWRRVLPELQDYELVLGPLLDELRPDVVLACGVELLGVGARAVYRRRAAGDAAHLVYDRRRELASPDSPADQARTELEGEFLGAVDAVLAPAASLIPEPAVTRPDAVVLDAPLPVEPAPRHRTVRTAADVPDDAILLLWIDVAGNANGLEDLVDATYDMPGAPYVVVLSHRTPSIEAAVAHADALGMGERMRVVTPPEPDDLAAFTAGADAGVITELTGAPGMGAVPRSLLTLVHGGVPVVAPHTPEIERFLSEHFVGATFNGDSVVSLRRTLRTVVDKRATYRAAIDDAVVEETSWDTQATRMLAVLTDLTGFHPAATPRLHTIRERATAELSVRTQRGPAEFHLAIGPTNMAGQGTAWAEALERAGGVATRTFQFARETSYGFPTDVTLTNEMRASREWQRTQADTLLGWATHLLCENGLSLFGALNGGWASGDVPMLAKAGLHMAVVLHGSEIRHPDRHRQLEPWSPFNAMPAHQVERLQVSAEQLARRLIDSEIPLFLTTNDLMDYVDGTWLPTVVDMARWQTDVEPLQTEEIVVTHIPSRGTMKGTAVVDRVIARLAEDPHLPVTYRRLEDLHYTEVPKHIQSADIVIDQLALGEYGVAAVEAMAAGRVVVANVADRVRSRIGEDLPIVQATPATLEDVIRDIAERRETYRATALRGFEYARAIHDGRRSVEILTHWMRATRD